MDGHSVISAEILASYAADAAREADGVRGLVESALHRHKGVRVEDEDGRPARFRTVLAWWFCLNPLLYSWPMALVAGAPIAALLFLVLNVFALFVLALVVLVCVAAPIVAFASAVANGENRALHDRVAGIVVSPVVR